MTTRLKCTLPSGFMRSYNRYDMVMKKKLSSSSSSSSSSSGRRNRPMVHLSSAPNEKFTGKKIGSSYPIIPHAITPQQNIDMRRNGVNATTSVPPYAAASNHVPGSEHEQEQEQIITINDKTTINKIRKASQLAAQMLDKACAMAQQQQKEKTGPSSYHTTDEIDKTIHDLLINDIHNAYPSPLNYNNYPKSICCSINEVICHGIPDVRPLKDGDLLSIDVSVYLDGVHGDNCRSIIIGNDSSDGYCDDEIMEQKARAQKLIDATREAMYLAIDICKHGTPLNQIGITIQDVAEEYGFRPMKSVCGHGIGTELHMFPPIKHFHNSDDSIILKPGMVITIEPALVEGHHAHATWDDGWSKCTVDGGLSAQFEHTILITEDGGPEILTLPGGSDNTPIS